MNRRDLRQFIRQLPVVVTKLQWHSVGQPICRGRSQKAVVAIVPAELIEAYEALLDQEDGRIAMERLAEIADGREITEPWEEVRQHLSL